MHLCAIPVLVALALAAQPGEAEDTNDVSYTVHRVEELPAADASWDDPVWQRAETLTITSFHPRGSDHRPKTEARLLHDGTALAVMFRVEDQYVVAKRTEYQQPTHKDSCVEFFVQPNPDGGYFNFEMNAIGTLLLWFVEDPTRVGGAFAKYTPVPHDVAQKIVVHTSLTGPIDEEMSEAVIWIVSYRIPLSLFEAFAGDLDSFSGLTWRGNFYKCADESSHPHWGYWADIGQRLDFHQPSQFAPIVFE